MARRPHRHLVLAAAAAVLAGAPGTAQETASERIQVDLELVLAVDISRSMDYDEQYIQQKGYVAAFRDERVIDALLGGFNGRVAVTYLEWANEFTQDQVVPWTLIESEDDAFAFAAAIDSSTLNAVRGTSISGALRAAADLINTNAYDSFRKVIDISGDGSNRDGPPVGPIRDAIVASGITINGLPLMLRPADFRFETVDLESYFREEVIGGSGAFVLPVRDISELPGSIRQKLILEIVGDPTLGPRAEAAGGATAAE